jgi:16S rRNA (guanine527-N7)-methyltransferase
MTESPSTDRTAFVRTLRAGADALGIAVSDDCASLLWHHFETMRDTNRQFNLTRLTEPQEAAIKLYADSIAPIAWRTANNLSIRTALDVGTGAGFPAVPLAVLQPRLAVTAIDTTAKKANFVQRCADSIPIPNLRAAHARAGEWRPGRTFDLVLFKAIGRLDKCVTCARRLIARDGHVIVFKGPALSKDELDAGQLAAEQCGLQTWDVFDYGLPMGPDELSHTLVVYRRVP